MEEVGGGREGRHRTFEALQLCRDAKSTAFARLWGSQLQRTADKHSPIYPRAETLNLLVFSQHATRVSAVSIELLRAGHSVTVVTNAPELPFAAILPPSAVPSDANPGPAFDSLPQYATYRKRNVDAGIVQPKAYDVDRRATYDVLKTFLDGREETLKEEVAWLKEGKFDAVLSDATFLGWCVLSSSSSSETGRDRLIHHFPQCSAAGAAADIPAILVSK